MDRPSRREVGDLHDGLVAEFQRVQAGLAAQTSPPSSLQPITAGTQACRAASSRNAWIAPGQASASPMRVAGGQHHAGDHPVGDAALPLGEKITLLSRRSAK